MIKQFATFALVAAFGVAHAADVKPAAVEAKPAVAEAKPAAAVAAPDKSVAPAAAETAKAPEAKVAGGAPQGKAAGKMKSADKKKAKAAGVDTPKAEQAKAVEAAGK